MGDLRGSATSDAAASQHDPSKVATTSALPLPPANADGGGDDAVRHALRRAELAKMRRTLDQRLGFASFKALRGWARYNLDAIEPEVERELHDRKRQAYEAAAQAEEASNKRRAVGGDRPRPAHMRAESMHHPYPPGVSLFDTMLNPSMGPLPGSYSPNLEPTVPPAAKRARLDGPGHAPPRLPTSAMKHRRAPSAAGSHVTWSHDLPQRSVTGVSPHPPHSAPLYRPLSTSDPHFATSATEFVDAATALTSFTRANSTAPTEVEAPIHEASGPEGQQDRESAAELMLFLAASPSPPRTKRATSTTSSAADFGGSGGPPSSMLPRRLFGDDDAASGSGASTGTGGGEPTPLTGRLDSPVSGTDPSSQHSSYDPPRSAPAKIKYTGSNASLGNSSGNDGHRSPTPPLSAHSFTMTAPHSVAAIGYAQGAVPPKQAGAGQRGSIGGASSNGLGSAFDFDSYLPVTSPTRPTGTATAWT